MMKRTLARRSCMMQLYAAMLVVRCFTTTTTSQVCSIAGALEVVGERWSLLIVRDIMLGLRRFDELQAELGIARNVLQSRLTRLLEQGVLEQAPLPGAPAALRVPPDREGPRPVADDASR